MAKTIKIEEMIIGKGRVYFLFLMRLINFSHQEISENDTVEPNNLIYNLNEAIFCLDTESPKNFLQKKVG